MYEDSQQRGSAYLIAEIPGRDRPRERLERLGSEALSDSELLAILLRTGRRGRSVLDLSRDVLGRFNDSLDALASATVPELRSVHGIGQAKAVEIRAAFELAKRLAKGRLTAERLRFSDPVVVADYMREELRTLHQEELRALLLDTKHFLIRQVNITRGLVNCAHAHAREVFRAAIRESATRIVLVHNHPSGDPTPSDEDIQVTEKLVQAGKIIGIDVADHVIIGKRTVARPVDFLSMRREKLVEGLGTGRKAN